MIRYHFSLTKMGVKFHAHVKAYNAMSAFSKVKRENPDAEHIHLIRSEKVGEY